MNKVLTYGLIPLILAVIATALTNQVTPLAGLSYAGKGWPIAWNIPLYGNGPMPFGTFNLAGFIVDIAFFYLCFCVLIFFIKKIS